MKTTQDIFGSMKSNFATLLALTLALGGLASAQGHHGKTGTLKLTQQTRIGDAVLQPGEYRVRTVKSAGDAEVEFVRETYDPTITDSGLLPYGEEFVARVKSSEQALSAPSKHTQVETSPETATASALEIRGDSVQYVFDAMPVQIAGAMAGSACAAQ